MRALFEDLRTEEERALAETVRRFVKEEVKPYFASSPDDEFPRPLFARLCAMGLGGIPFPAEYGGGGADYATYALVLEELAVAGGALAGTLSVHGLPQLILSRFGTPEQKRRFLPRLAGGELLGAFALTEPGTGSDAAAIATRAVADPDGYRIHGSKAWITHSTVADLFVLFARTGEREISAFLVEKSAPGLTPLPPERKTGLRRSPTGGLSLEGVRVPAGALVGRPGDGLGIALTALDSGRITIGALAVGICRGALDAAVGYVRTRMAFGRPLEKNDVVRARLAEMTARTEAAAALVREAARLRDRDLPNSAAAAAAKLVATDAALFVTAEAVQLCGATGVSEEFPAIHLFNDAKIAQIVEGANDVQRMVLARALLA
ncbi:MAG TPA: acyl-CoA dehydrogenase family protein [Thermoanaerobaculia bacterium]|nr:acyl-CoA dehydrogenase family protein [Thermoanaerobaculia bacterium]